ncbi:MAG: EVE domain-containing protein [Chthoniobacterales bacterium]
MPKQNKHYWLVKQEPSAYSWDTFVKDGKTDWTGVRNYQARNNLRAMHSGDAVLFYHSVTGKAIVGEATVTKEAFPDPTASEGDWSCVELRPVAAFSSPVELATIKQDPALSEIALIRQSRLSVLPLTAQEYKHILKLGNKAPNKN